MNFDQFVWSLRPYLCDQLGLSLRPIWLITSTLFAWSGISRYLSVDLCDNLFEHKTMFTTKTFVCSTVHKPTTHPHIPISSDRSAWSRRPYLSDHLFLVTFWLICEMTCANTKLYLLQSYLSVQLYMSPLCILIIVFKFLTIFTTVIFVWSTEH